ncbi:MAG: hypothetical protein QNJ56_05990 [Gammaproteobacteria bacterium]|nr:hypothetical protein [Gammaproteobacteria bacterium]
MKNYRNHCFLTRCKLFTGWWLFLFLPGIAAASNIQSFAAIYDVYQNDQKIGTADFNFKKENGVWVWRMQTYPKAPYSWLTRKKPFAETRMMETDNGLQLSQELRGDYPDQVVKENTWFNQDKGTIYFTKGETDRLLDLPGNLYNIQSIHLIPSIMKRRQMTQMDIQFYKKGKLFKSRMVLEPRVLMANSSQGSIYVDRLTQQLEPSKYRMVYYYREDAMAPLKIEQIKANGEYRVMWRTGLE